MYLARLLNASFSIYLPTGRVTSAALTTSAGLAIARANQIIPIS